MQNKVKIKYANRKKICKQEEIKYAAKTITK
jgi:hypothetical protein